MQWCVNISSNTSTCCATFPVALTKIANIAFLDVTALITVVVFSHVSLQKFDLFSFPKERTSYLSHSPSQVVFSGSCDTFFQEACLFFSRSLFYSSNIYLAHTFSNFYFGFNIVKTFPWIWLHIWLSVSLCSQKITISQKFSRVGNWLSILFVRKLIFYRYWIYQHICKQFSQNIFTGGFLKCGILRYILITSSQNMFRNYQKCIRVSLYKLVWNAN